MHERDSFFAHAVTFLLTFIGDDDEPVAHCAPSSFIERVARFVVCAPAHASAVVGAVAGVLADVRDAG